MASPSTGTRLSCKQCGKLANESEIFQKCAACRLVVYCGSACQRLDWKTHKDACKAEAASRFHSAVTRAEAGHRESSFDVGVCYAHGYGVPKDPVKAVTWYRSAAEADHSDAQLNLGV